MGKEMGTLTQQRNEVVNLDATGELWMNQNNSKHGFTAGAWLRN